MYIFSTPAFKISKHPFKVTSTHVYIQVIVYMVLYMYNEIPGAESVLATTIHTHTQHIGISIWSDAATFSMYRYMYVQLYIFNLNTRP